MRLTRRPGGTWAVALGLLLAAVPTARGAEEETVLRLRGERLAAQGHCQEAIPLLEKVLAARASDARAAFVAGQCRVRQQRYTEAAQLFERARQADPGLAEAELYLGIARFHQGDLAAAEQALDAAAPRLPDRAELHLYRGLVLLQRAQSREAATALERARTGDPDLDPIASYYAGLAWADAEERKQAEEALRRARQHAPGTEWATEADRALERLAAGATPPWWLRATLGGEYDDNVVLRAQGVTLPDEIGRAHDVRAVWELEAGRQLWRGRDWGLGARLAYRGSAHQDLEDFNDHYPVGSLWLDRRLSERALARLQYDLGYAWYQGDPFLVSHVLTPAVFRYWGAAGRTELFARLRRYNFLFGNDDVVDAGAGGACPPGFLTCGPPGLDEDSARNRDGQGVSAGVEHVLPLALAEARLRGGYTYHRYSARGSEYSFQGHEVHAGAQASLPAAFVLDALVSYTYRPYRNRSTFPDPADVRFDGNPYPLQNERRSDDAWRFEVGLGRAVTESLSAAVRYGYYKQHSNAAVFDYDREILGFYLTLALQP